MTVLPPVGSGAAPADVRGGSRQERAAYDAALGFERVLLGQLTASLQRTATGEDGEGAGPYASLIPETLADALVASGGLGLADDLSRSLRTGGTR